MNYVLQVHIFNITWVQFLSIYTSQSMVILRIFAFLAWMTIFQGIFSKKLSTWYKAYFILDLKSQSSISYFIKASRQIQSQIQGGEYKRAHEYWKCAHCRDTCNPYFPWAWAVYALIFESILKYIFEKIKTFRIIYTLI